MPSSTSSFERTIPDRPWLRMAALAAALIALLATGWEILCRARGFRPTLDDTPDLWAQTRARLDDAPADAIVLLGSSRMLFDMDLDEVERATGRRPIQLATVGTNELFLLEKLADDPHFRGTAIVSFVPSLTFLPPGAATSRVKKGVERYEKGSIAQKLSARMWQWLDARLAFLNGDELTLRKLIEQADLPQRAGAEGAACFLPYLYSLDADRRARLFDGVVTDATRRDNIRAAWTFADPPSQDPIEQQAAELEALRQQTLWRERAAVTKLRAHGARVIYVRFPSSGAVREVEDALFPRALTWDALLAVTGAPGIHFQDDPQLASFECPEWSHLSAADSVAFTHRLMLLLAPYLARQPSIP
jgi:hypothetical protein